jgi:hypothetical protein
MSAAFEFVPIPAKPRDMFMLVETRTIILAPPPRRIVRIEPDLPTENPAPGALSA